jgi:DNA-binding NarL/FixJ family response regulator
VTVRVLLVVGPEPARREVAALLTREDSVEIVEQAASVAEALAAVTRQGADVALLAARLPDGDGLALCRELRARLPDLRCLVLTGGAEDATDSGDDALFDAIMAGASGFAPRHGTDLVDAVRTVGSGGSLLDQRATATLLARLRRERQNRNPMDLLAPQERAVLHLIGAGFANRQIAAALLIADKVVKTHVSHLMGKFGLHRRTQLVELATKLRAARGLAG